MLVYLLRRAVFVFVPALLGISILVFLVIRLIPGSYVDVMLGTTADVTPEQIEALNRSLGLDQPLPVQYILWLKNVLMGDLGTSLRSGNPVVAEIGAGLPVTLELTLLSLGAALLVGIPAGVIAAVKQNTVADAVARVGALVGLSVPNFLLATLLILFISLYLPILPTTGFTPLSEGLIPNLRSMILPTLALAVLLTASIMRMVRSSMLEEMRREYATVARAKGLSERQVNVRHVLRNSLLPVITTVGIQMGYLLGGTIIIEQIFALPGIGRLSLTAIGDRDYPLVQGVVLFVAAAFITVNFLTDMAYGWVDPRIRHGNK